MTMDGHVMRDVFAFLACVTLVGLTLSAVKFNPFAITPLVNIIYSSGDLDNNSTVGTSPSSRTVADRSSLQSGDHRLSSNKTNGTDDYWWASSQNVSTLAPSAASDELDKILARTANRNKTVIITALNGAWSDPNSMIDLFMESFHGGEGTQQLLNNLLIVALDAKAYNRCLAIHPHCYILKTEGVDFSAEKVYMSQDYLKMMWRRLVFLGDVLKRGYSFVFSDTDVMWLRDPLPKLPPDADIRISSDKFQGGPYDISNIANTGFKYVRSNERTIRFYRDWYLSRLQFPGQTEQNVLNNLKSREYFGRRSLSFVFLDTKHFGGFCERSRYLDDAYTMHANCCKGLKAKIIDLREALNDWLHYKSAHRNTTRSKVQWRLPNSCLNSWHS